MANRSLFDLSVDILITICKRLSFDDLVRLAAVCKNWRKIVRDTVQHGSCMPWLLTFDMRWCKSKKAFIPSIFELYDIWCKQTYSLEKFTEKEEVRGFFIDFSVHDFKYGWLLCEKQVKKHTKKKKNVRKNGGSTISYVFFFYNPFCEKIIKVDPLDLNRPTYQVSEVTFTAPPTSPNCVIFVLWRDKYDGPETKVIYTYTIGDGRWNILHKTKIHSEKFVWDVAYMDETLYCIFYSEEDCTMELGSMRLSSSSSSSCVALDQDWVMVDFTDSLRLKTSDRHEGQLIEYDGKLLLAIQNDVQNIWQIYQLDSSKKDWTMIKSLGNQVLFLGCTGMGTSIIVPAKEEASELANLIFWPGSGCYDHYSSYTCKTPGNWSFQQTYKWYNLKDEDDCDQFHILIPSPLIN